MKNLNLKLKKIESLSPNWVTGIIDAEGNFSIIKKESKNGYNPGFSFKVTQNYYSYEILVYLKEYFKCGNINIDNKKTKGYKYQVSNTNDIITKIIPQLDKYPLITSKRLDYLDWKESLIRYKNDKKRNDLDYIWLKKDQMNKNRSFEERWEYLNNCDEINLSNEWVQAFIDGEGSFQFNIINTKNRGKSYLALNSTLEVAQHSHDVKVLSWIKKFFNKGYLKPKFDINNLIETKEKRSVSRFIINQESEVIKFIDKYPMYTSKRLDYEDWKLLIKLKEEGVHKTSEGLIKMKKIRLKMNRGRYKEEIYI